MTKENMGNLVINMLEGFWRSTLIITDKIGWQSSQKTLEGVGTELRINLLIYLIAPFILS